MAFAGINHPWLHLFLLMSLVAISLSAGTDCVYTLYIKTAPFAKAGTESNVSVTFYDTEGNGIEIGNVVKWGGRMDLNHKYFKSGGLDIFSNTAPCLPAPICSMNLTLDGSGPNPGWFSSDVELTVATVNQACAKELFIVEQWLATDAIPYELWAFRDNCDFRFGKGVKSPGSGSRVAKV